MSEDLKEPKELAESQLVAAQEGAMRWRTLRGDTARGQYRGPRSDYFKLTLEVEEAFDAVVDALLKVVRL